MGTIRSEVQEQHLNKYPEEKEFLIPFTNGFFITRGNKRTAFQTEVSEYFLNPEDFMKELFGFEQEILLIYSPYNTLEPRTLQVAEFIFESEPAKTRVEKYNYILVTNAEKPQEWVNTYQLMNQDKRIIIAFNKQELIINRADSWYIRRKLTELLYGRDLFDYRLPLKNDYSFFGRSDLVMDYFDAARRSENKGIFGLRKTGKTSLLYKIKRQIEQNNIGQVYYYDAKNPSIRSLKWYELVKKILIDIANNNSFNIESKNESIYEITDNFERIIKKIAHTKIIIALDEIEYISPISLTNVHWKSDFIDFWQFFWSLQSSQRNISFIIIGVNPYVAEIDNIEGIQNPLFGIVSSRFLKGLPIDDLRLMVKTLGKKMGLNFDFDTYQYLWARYGGHPLLTRMACSLINRNVVDKKYEKPYEVTLDFLKKNEDSRDSDLIFYCRHVVSELNQFYPEEYEMLEMLACGQISDFTELAIYPEYSKHLYDYGLINNNENSLPIFTIEAVKRYIGIENARKENRRTIFKIVLKEDRVLWLSRRKDSIVQDLRQLEKAIDRNGLIKLFGVNSFPEADKFVNSKVCNNEDDFVVFINTLNRCFVESIESYGKSIDKSEYYWKDIKSTYPGIWYALNRIKAYRVDKLHLALTKSANKTLQEYLDTDLENRKYGQIPELYFHLQQATIDGLLTGIQIEINKIDS